MDQPQERLAELVAFERKASTGPGGRRVVVGGSPPSAWRGCCLTIGNFDGLHVGHQELLGTLLEMARRLGRPAVAMTFHPHPAEVLAGKSPKRLMSLEDRVAGLLSRGLDGVWVIPFSVALAAMEAEAFVEELLLSCLAIAGVVVGPDSHFGAGRRGDGLLLARLGVRHGFETAVVPALTVAGERVSSSAVRAALAAGLPEAAAAMLGRCYRMKGTVTRGQRLGSRIGYPTANLELLSDLLIPARGIYAVRVRLGEELDSPLDGVANVGIRPTIGEGPLLVEAHLFGVARELYGERITVEFHRRLRDEMRFADLGELRRAIAGDVESAKAYFQSHR